MAHALRRKGRSDALNESEMALFYECMPLVRSRVLDSADIVRDRCVIPTAKVTERSPNPANTKSHSH